MGVVCPACGFRIYNRRYPTYESCGSQLPTSVVYAAEESKELFTTTTTMTSRGVPLGNAALTRTHDELVGSRAPGRPIPRGTTLA